MKKSFLRVIAALLLPAAFATAVSAQQMPPAPVDTAVVTGKLDNGLTYFIRHNELPKGQADFYIAQNVGSILEEDNQRGLAHFLEHMCFNGTKNFPGKGIINWLESVGVKFGRNLNAYTSIEETVYNISNVPVERTSVQDSCLLILHDWSCDLTLDPAEIDAERGVIHEEWRQAMVGSMRIMENLLPKVYPDNRYGERLPIGTMEVVDNFPHQALVDYYHKWYRPDNQAIIVVGDIDPAYIEGKIKEIFSPVKMPENAAERLYFEVEETPGTIYAIGSDKEMQMPVVDMYFKSNDVQLPRQYRNSQAYFQVNYITSMIEDMLNARLDELSQKPECEFAQAGISIGDFLVSKTMGAVELQVVAKDTDVVPAFTQAYRELLRAVKGGFTVGEYERTRAEFLSRLESQYTGRADRQNEYFSRAYVRQFIDNIPASGIENTLPIYKQTAQLITVDMLNQFLPSVISEDNRILLAMLPEAEGFVIPTEEMFVAAVEAVDAEELEPYKDQMREDPLIPELPAPGKVIKVGDYKHWGAKEYTLSNGVKVVVKPTDFKADQIVFQAIALGNANSTLDQSQAASIKYADMALSALSLYNYTSSDIKKYMQGKQAQVGIGSSDYTREVTGQSTVKDLPTLMELIYAYFTGIGLDEQEFIATRDAMAGILANQTSTPNFAFSRDLMKSLFAAPAKQVIEVEDVKNADRQVIVDFTRAMLANAADYTFFFVGNIDEATFIPLMEQYIATLPADAANASKSYTGNAAFEPQGGNKTDTYTMAMETPQTFVFIGIMGKVPFSTKNQLVASAAGQVLSKRLLNKVREEMNAVYSIGAVAQVGRTNELNAMIQTAFPMKPELKDQTLKVIREICEAMTQDVTAEELKPAIEYLTKTNTEAQKENDEWAGYMVAECINGVDTFTGRQEVINSITVEDIQNFMRDMLAQDNYRVVILDPEAGTAVEATETPAE